MTGGVGYDMFGSTIKYYGIHREETSGRCDPGFCKAYAVLQELQEELEIYYTLIVGMHQVDNNQELSQNFAKDLENELNRLEHRVKQAKRFKFSTFGLVFGVAVVFLFLYTINVWIRYIISNSG